MLALPAAPRPGPLLLGFSGGLDSTVLLHLLASNANIRSAGLRAIHVHHGMQDAADDWVRHCERACADLGVALEVCRVRVDTRGGLGPEGAARAARHAAFAQALRPEEILTLAHHRDDQAETFLLRALRGAGVDGLASMREWRAFASGWLWRPLLAQPRAALIVEAQRRGLAWVDDPSNAGTAPDRNLLRNAVLPLLATRWPHAGAALARSAALAAESAALLDDDDARLLDAMSADAEGRATLPVAALRALPAPRRARVVRLWLSGLGMPPPPARVLAAVDGMLASERHDAQPSCDWAGVRIQRWRGLLHAGAPEPPLPADWSASWDGAHPLALPTGDRLHLDGAVALGKPVTVRARRGGERIRLPGRTHTHQLKHVLQARGVPPWDRGRLPLLVDAEGHVLAAGDTIVSATLLAWLETAGARLRWQRLA